MAINETDNFVKSSIGWLELVNYASAPIDTDASRRGLAFVGGTLKYWSGSAWTTVSGAGGASTFDEIYDNDKILSIDDGTLTFLLPSGETVDAVLFQAQATATGDCIQITNAGTGKDIQGTSNTWNVTKAGAATFASVVAESVTAAANLTLEATGAGTIGIGASSSGTITLGAGGGSVVVTNGLTISGTADANKLTITAGDMLMSNGKIAVTNDDTDAILTMTANAVTTGNAILLTANGVTSGNLLSLVTTAAGFSGGNMISCTDGAATFTVGVDMATKIASAVATTKALEITGIQTSENMVTLTSSGVTADNKAIILIDSSGNSAAGSNQIRIAPSGTAVETSVGIEFVGASKLMQAMVLDADCVDNSVVAINGGGALASDKAVLEVSNDGNLASGGNLARFTIGGTPNAAAVGIEVVGAGKALTALSVDADPTASNVVLINGGGALTDGLAVLGLTNDGNLATGGSILHLTMGGTPHTAANAVEITASKDAQALVVTSSAATNHAVEITCAGAIATTKSALYVTASGTPAAATSNVAEITFTGTATNNPVVLNVNNGTADALPMLVTSNVAAATREVAMFVQDSTTGANEVLSLQQDDVSEPFIDFVTTIGVGNAIEAVGGKTNTATHFIMVKIPGGLTRYISCGTIA